MTDVDNQPKVSDGPKSCHKSKENNVLLQEVTFEDSIQDKDFAHACHCMVWSKWTDHFIIHEFLPKAAILMQMRFDGCLGFPGGMVDEDLGPEMSVDEAMEKCLSAVTRELAEEMNVDYLQNVLTKNDYMLSYRHSTKKLMLHFFSFEISMDKLREVENMALKAMDFGDEVMGITRVPLYTMHDGYRGFPAFLNNNFIPCSRQQLLHGVEKLNILTKEEIDKAVNSSIQNRATFN